MSTRTGRPKSDDPKSERLYIRVTPKQKEEIFSFCRQNGYTLLALIQKGMETAKQ